MLTSVKFENFKRFTRYQIDLKDENVLVGPNNSGKSTILDAFRILEVGLRIANRMLPRPLPNAKSETDFGYAIPLDSLPISHANIHNNYRDIDTIIKFSTSENQNITIKFPEDGGCYLILDGREGVPRSLKEIKRRYPFKVFSIPTLTPFESEEQLLTEKYFQSQWGGRLSSRMFRNYWHRDHENFSDFSEMVENTWPGLEILRPEQKMAGPKQDSIIHMFYRENRILREIYWSGFGFQIWLQLLTHLTNCSASDVLVIDEPDVYLHPDLQRRFFNLLRNIGGQFILATHSVEIINEAPLQDIVTIDSKNSKSIRVNDSEELQGVMNYIGSSQNIELTKLSRDRRLVFFEGNDFRIIRQICRKIGFDGVADAINFTVIKIGGFSKHTQISNTAWIFESILKSDIEMFALFDRDYRPNEEIKKFIVEMKMHAPQTYVLPRKEIENFILDRIAIKEAAYEAYKKKSGSVVKRTTFNKNVDQIFDDVIAELRDGVVVSLGAELTRYYRSSGRDTKSCMEEAFKIVNEAWKREEEILKYLPGKNAFSLLNRKLQGKYNSNITHNAVIRNMKKSNIDSNLYQILVNLNEFAASP